MAVALPLLILVKSAAGALKHWRSLPSEQREQLRDTATNVRRLAVELAGPKAGKLMGDEADGVAQPAASRNRDAVARELRDELAILAAAGGSAAASGSARSRKGKLLAKVADVGARQIRDRADKPTGSDEGALVPERAVSPAAAVVTPVKTDEAAVTVGPMPTALGWSVLSSEIEAVWGGTRPSPTMLAFEVDLEDRGRKQRMFATRENIGPDLEFLHLQTAIGLVEELDLATVLDHAGSIAHGSLGHLPQPGGRGIVTFGMKLPVKLLDRRELEPLMVLIHLLARTADGLEQDYAGVDAPDRY